MAARNAEQTRCAPRHGGHNHRTTGEKVDVSGELPGLVNDDHPLAVRRISDFDLTVFNNVQIDFRLTGPEDGLAVGVVASRRQGPDETDLCAGQAGKCRVLNLSHGWYELRNALANRVQYLSTEELAGI